MLKKGWQHIISWYKKLTEVGESISVFVGRKFCTYVLVVDLLISMHKILVT